MLKVFHVDMNMVSLKKDYITALLHKLAAMDYNAILWELENKVQWETCPECVDGDALSKADFREILEVSRRLGLEPIPLLQTVGHAEYILIHPPYHKFRENPDRHDCYCTSNPEVRTFVRNLVLEYLDLFGPLNHFHLGGDEAYEFGSCPVCKEYCQKHGSNRLYAEYLADIAKPVFERGVRPGIWPDMVLHHPEELDAVSRDFMMWDWNYWGSTVDPNHQCAIAWGVAMFQKPEDVPEHIRQTFPDIIKDGRLNPFHTVDFLKRHGYDVILCSASRSAQDSNHCGRHHIHAPNIYSCTRKAMESSLAGFCVTSWAIRMHPYETQLPWLMLGTVTAALPVPDYQDALDRVSEKLFGQVHRDFFTALNLIGQSFWFNNSRHLGIQWNALKDGTKPPAGFIATIVAQLQEDTVQWKNAPDALAKSGREIREGIAMLNGLFDELATANSPGLATVEAWLLAGNLQMLQLALARAALRRADGVPLPVETLRETVATAKALYQAARPGETAASVKWNAEQVYDSLADYLGLNE